jgi:hypothetical protein
MPEAAMPGAAPPAMPEAAMPGAAPPAMPEAAVPEAAPPAMPEAALPEAAPPALSGAALPALPEAAPPPASATAAATGDAAVLPQPMPADLAARPAEPPAPAAAPPRVPPPVPALQVAPVAVALAMLPGDRSALRIALEPPELGRVEVRIIRGSDGEDSVRILVERPETLALLQRDRAELGRALDQAGMQAGGGLSLGLASQGGGGDGAAPRDGGGPGRGLPTGPTATPAPPERAAPAGSGTSLLDIAI